MIRKLLIPILVILTFTSCGSDDDNVTPPKKVPSKLVKITILDENLKEKETPIEITYGKNGYASRITGLVEGESEAFYTYNDKNQLVAFKNTFKENGKVYFSETYSYAYSEKGLLISELLKGKERSEKTVYEYNEKNLMVKKIGNFDSEFKTISTYEYDKNGNVTIEHGAYDSKTTYTFDDKKNPWSLVFPKESLMFKSKNNKLSEQSKYDKTIHSYTYNNDNYPVKVVSKYYNRGKLESTEIRKFFYE